MNLIPNLEIPFGFDAYFMADLNRRLFDVPQGVAGPDGLVDPPLRDLLVGGIRLFGSVGNHFQYSLEGVLQQGWITADSEQTEEALDADVSAFSAEVGLEYRFGAPPPHVDTDLYGDADLITTEPYVHAPRPTISLTYTLASGDSDPTDDTISRYDPLFQDGHPRMGLSDFLVGSNIHALTAAYRGRLCPCGVFSAEVDAVIAWAYTAADTTPGLFGVVPSRGGESRGLGAGGDASITWHVVNRLDVQLAGGVMVPLSPVEARLGRTPGAAWRTFLNGEMHF